MVSICMDMDIWISIWDVGYWMSEGETTLVVYLQVGFVMCSYRYGHIGVIGV